jgi:6-phosphogluconolactonase (cycloisomerase 2 family)
MTVSGSHLFVVNTFQPLTTCSTAEPCSGSVGVYPILPVSGSTPKGKLGTPAANGSINYWPLTVPGKTGDVIVPTGVNVLPSGNFAYVTAYDSSVTPNVGYVFGYAVASSGVLTPLKPFAVGVHPSAVASDSSSSYVYVADYTSGVVHGFSVSTSGLLTKLSGSPFVAGNQPAAIIADPKYNYVYVANSLDGSVTGYSIGSNGVLTRITTMATGIQPVAIGIDPSSNHFLFTANFLGSNVSDFEINITDGSLVSAMNSPYTSNAQPTAVAAIAYHSNISK